MGERRKRKSFWDMEEETKHLSGMSEHNSWTGKARHSSHGSGRYHEFSESRTTITQKSRDHSGWPSWESIEENPTAPINDSFKNIPEGKERGGGKRYYNNMSPGFDGIELRNHDRTHEYIQTHSQRHLGRGRSRSRSRTERRSWSRSLSRGRERERRRGWSRSRSRSRSRSDGYAKKYTRSRSPLGDYRHQSYGWSDTRGGPEKSSQLCRDFAAGGCKRASQCRFFHPCSISCRDGDPMEDDTMGSWRSRADHSRIQKHSYTRGFGFVSQNDVSDPYYGEDEQFIKRSRSAVPCKDFMKGNCRWGGTCRFSHHAVSDDSFGQKTRNSFFDKDIDRQPYKNRKPLCKYFAAGKCSKDNCRFSHEDPSLDNLERRRAEVTDSRSSHDKSNRWNGLAWDDAKDPSLDNLERRRAEISDSRSSHDKSNWWNGPMGDDATRITAILKPTGVSESILGNTTSINDSVNGQNDDSGAHNLESENKIWGILEGTSASLNSEKQPLLPGESSGSYGRDTGPTESIAKENMTTNKQEHLMLRGSQMQNQDGITNVHGQNALQENQSFSIKALQQNFFLASNIQPQHGAVLEYNQANKFGSGVPAELEEIRYTTRPILFSGQSLNQNGGSIFTGNSLITNESEGQNILCPNPSNEYITDLNEPKTHTVGPLNVQTQMLNIQKAVQSPRLLETKVPQLLTNQHSDQGAMSPVNTAGQQIPPATDPVSLTRGFKNEHSQTYARIEDPSSGGMMPFFPNTSGRVPPVNTSTVQPNSGVVSLDLLNSLGNGRYNIERSNLAQGREQNNQMQPNLSSPLPVVAMEVDRFNLKHPQSPRLRQDETVPISEPTGDIKATGEENEGGQENKNSETVDGHVKVEEGSSNKDEKGLRMFKNALVEFLKEILKPTWKEGRMSREVHKTVVKKVVDKVSSTIQVEHIPKTQDKVEQYLQISKPKITKLVQAYVERSLKADS